MKNQFLKLSAIVLCVFTQATFSSAPVQMVTTSLEEKMSLFSLVKHPGLTSISTPVIMLEWMRNYKKSLLLDCITYEVNDYVFKKRQPIDNNYHFEVVNIPAKIISAIVDDREIGYVIVCPNVSNNDQYFFLSPVDGNKATIELLFVQPAWRRQGIADELLKKALKNLKKSKNNEPVEIRLVAYIQEESYTLDLAHLTNLYQNHGAQKIGENKDMKIVLMTFPARS